MRYVPMLVAFAATACCLVLGITVAEGWLWVMCVVALVFLLGLHDMLQIKHSILRNYPILGHFRFMLEKIRPEMQQYFVERDWDGRPYNRDVRSQIYERAKDIHGEMPFGTDLDVYKVGYEFFTQTLAPKQIQESPFRVRIGGKQCKQPYDMALLNVSAMSFGALSCNAIRALNAGAKKGGFAHDTGEGGLTQYHLEHGGDLVWEIGTAYFGCRTMEGKFDPEKFKEKASHPNVKCISIKLSQGAKPGLGGVMPAAKVTEEIAEIRGVPVGVKCISPSGHTAFSTPKGLIEFVAQLRELSGGKPTGFKLCVGKHHEFAAICKAMLETGITPDFIIIDGGEGGTGAAPLEWENHVGVPLLEGLMFAHNMLVGAGLREQIKVGASGKISNAITVARALCLGADYTNAARAMMMAVGCIQAQRCQTNTCPVGVATQDPKRYKALHVGDKAERVHHFQQNVMRTFNELLASLGLESPDELAPHLLFRRLSQTEVKCYQELFPHLNSGDLIAGCDAPFWKRTWNAASADHWAPNEGVASSSTMATAAAPRPPPGKESKGH